MINLETRSLLSEQDENIVVFDNPSFDNSIIGTDYNNRVIYSYEEMITELMNDENLSFEDAVDFIDYNTLGSLCSIPNGPIIMYNLLK